MTKDEGGCARPLLNERPVMCYSKSWNTPSWIGLPSGKDMVMPGEDSQLVLKLHKAMIIEKNQSFTLREASGTLGTGKVAYQSIAKTL